ncbi:MAG: ferrous iron transport protein A [Firmicutes bacterium]|uniref:Ferrous iron transport protein A n=1 Tax=Candidatus Onthovivens merdipullorum TaxID=2840889 RepID=A0A9D9DJI4_9BACL|nr:ferrous iron transport protein A [Candidatus Onthovivens merdipullorum]
MPLVIAPLNTKLKVIKILLDDKTKKHLESLGITIDSELTLLDNTNGNVILMVKDGRLALDKNIATKILVR